MGTLKSFLSKNAGTSALIFVLTLSLGLNVYLARQRAIAAHPKPLPTLALNSAIPSSLPLSDADGKPVTLSFADDSRPTVLYVLSPQCGWCKLNEKNMKAVQKAAGSRFRFVGLSIDPKNLKQYVADGREPFPVYLLSSKDLIKKLRIYGTPETIVVSPAAKVKQLWQGAYLAENRKQVENFFDVSLPASAQ